MRAAVARGAHYCFHLIVPVAEQDTLFLGPDVESVHRAADFKLFVTGQTIGFIDPGTAGIDLIDRDICRLEILHQPGGALFPGIELCGQQTEGVIFQAVQPPC